MNITESMPIENSTDQLNNLLPLAASCYDVAATSPFESLPIACGFSIVMAVLIFLRMVVIFQAKVRLIKRRNSQASSSRGVVDHENGGEPQPETDHIIHINSSTV